MKNFKELNKIVANVISKFLIDNSFTSKIIESSMNDDGFFVDIIVEKNISEKQLPLIEGKLMKFISKLSFEKNQLKPKYIKLRGVSGIQTEEGIGNRIFGFAAETIDDLEAKIEELEEREARDHRRIGKDLEIFMVDETAGKGLPIWLPNGVALKQQIRDFIFKQEAMYDYMQVETSTIASIELFKTSGHYSHYKDLMFPEMTIEEGETFLLRPMACPQHVLIYKSKPRSFRELPFRLAEQVKQYRYEPSGALIGLERVRSMELTDSHIFIREDQIKSEIKQVMDLIRTTLDKFEVTIDYVELALHDPKNTEKYHGNLSMWKDAESKLKEFLDEVGIEYIEKIGEAAFYGPKIDIQIKTALGHTITVSTVQLDFLLPEKFDLHYVNSDQEQIRPILIHRGLIGTYERFISVLLEQTKGNFPMWLAPQQAVVITVNNKVHGDYAAEVYEILKQNGVRAKLDNSDERLANKIRIAQTSKVKSQLIIGDEEIASRTISVRMYGEEKTKSVLLTELVEIYKEN